MPWPASVYAGERGARRKRKLVAENFATATPGGGWGFRRQNPRDRFGERSAVKLTYLNCTQYGRSPGRRLFTRFWVLNETNSTRPLEMSEGRTESGLRRHCM